MKKFLSVLLVFAVISSMTLITNTSVFAEQSGDYTYTVTDSKAIITGYTGAGGSITIPDTLGIYPVTEIGQSAFKDNATLTQVSIPNSVTKVGNMSFYNCSELTKVIIGTGVKSFGYYPFNDCFKLTEIAFDKNNTYYSSLDGVVFNSTKTTLIMCPVGKTGIYIVPDTVTYISGNAFSNCSNLTGVTIPDSVKTIGDNAFNKCIGLTQVTIGNNLETIGIQAFVYCSELISATIGSGVTQIGNNAFGFCGKLEQINVDANNAVYASVDGVLLDKTKTSVVAFPTGKIGIYTVPDTITDISAYAFSTCTKLTKIIIPDTVTKIGEYAFYSCESLNIITIGSGVNSIANHAFDNCSNLTQINVSANNAKYSSRSGVLLNKLKTRLIRCPQGRQGIYVVDGTVVEIYTLAFDGCWRLDEIIIPTSVAKITTLAFKDCSGLDKITVSAKNKIYSSHNGILFNKSGKSLLVCPEGKRGDFKVPGGVEIISGNAFYYCNGIKTVTIPAGVVIIGKNAFFECNSLTKVTISGSVTAIYDGAFFGCNSLTAAYFLGNAPKMGTGVFGGCSSSFKVYYYTNRTGFKNPWNGYAAVGRKFISVKSVKISKTILTLKSGKSYKLFATINPSNASNKGVIWKSSDKRIASVSSTGYVKGIKRGITYIYVHTVSGNKIAKCKVTVT